MKKILSAILVVLFSVSVCLAADSYTESFSEENSRAHLNNLTVVPSMSSVLFGLVDNIPGYGLQQSTDRSGEIRYSVQGAEQLTVGFYAKNCSYAFLYGEDWILGLPYAGFSGESCPVYLGEDGTAYMQKNGIWYQYRNSRFSSDYHESVQGPSTAVPLNLQVIAVDQNGRSHTLSGTSGGLQPVLSIGNSIVAYYEERTYSIPSGTRELILSLNARWTIRNASGEVTAGSVTQNPVTVTRIRLDGTDLLFDQLPEPVSGPEQGSSSTGSSSSGTSSPESSSSGTGTGTSGGSGGGNSPDRWEDEIILPDNTQEATDPDHTYAPAVISGDSSKEELLSGSSSRKSSSGKTASSSASSQKDSDSESRSGSEPESETLIYQTDRDDLRDKLFAVMLAGYGVIGLGVAWQVYRHTTRKR